MSVNMGCQSYKVKHLPDVSQQGKKKEKQANPTGYVWMSCGLSRKIEEAL